MTTETTTRRYSVERALWAPESSDCIGSDIILETDDLDQAQTEAERDHAGDPNGQTAVYDTTTGDIVYDLRG
jgi:hypothetical protein